MFFFSVQCTPNDSARNRALSRALFCVVRTTLLDGVLTIRRSKFGFRNAGFPGSTGVWAATGGARREAERCGRDCCFAISLCCALVMGSSPSLEPIMGLVAIGGGTPRRWGIVGGFFWDSDPTTNTF